MKTSIDKLVRGLLILVFSISVGSVYAFAEDAASPAPASHSAGDWRSKKEDLKKLKAENPEEYARVVKERKEKIKEKLKDLKEKDPEKFKQVTEKMRRHRKERLEKLREENPEKYREVMEKKAEKLKELKEKDPKRYEKFMKNHKAHRPADAPVEKKD